MLLGRIQYVGKASMPSTTRSRGSTVLYSIASWSTWLDQEAFGSWSCAYLMDRPLPDLHPSGWAYSTRTVLDTYTSSGF